MSREDRIAKPVDDDEADIRVIPIIDDVRHVNIITETPVNDEFLRPADELKQYDGLGSAARRRTTNQMKKFYRGIDGAESKKIEEESDFTGYQMLDVVLPPYNLDSLAKLYQDKSSAHYAAVNAKVSNIVGLGYKLVETTKTKREMEQASDNEKKLKRGRANLERHREDINKMLEDFNEEDSFVETLIKVWKDYEATGNGYVEIGRKKNGEIGYIGHIPAQTVRLRKKRDGFIQISGHKMQFFANFGAGTDKNTGKKQAITNPLGGGLPNEIIHIKKYSPISGFYGVPDIIAALPAVVGQEYANKFNLDYFGNKAIPRHVIILKGAKLGNKAEQALMQFFETELKGQSHRSLYIPLPGDTDENKVELKFETIEAGVQDSSFMNYRKANLEDILMVHRVPLTKVSSGSGVSLALAKDADKTFKEQVCQPEQKIFEKKLNRIMAEITGALELKLNEMTLTDEDTQSKIDERNVKVGIDLPNEVRARRGLPPIPGGDERVDLNAKDKIAQAQAELTTQRERDSARSAGATDSAGDARNPKGEGRTTT